MISSDTKEVATQIKNKELVIERRRQIVDAAVKLFIQHGYHRYYILTIIVFTSIMVWYQVFDTGGFKLNANLSLDPFFISGLIAIIISAVIFSIFAKGRITTIIALGVVGYGISLIYLK